VLLLLANSNDGIDNLVLVEILVVAVVPRFLSLLLFVVQPTHQLFLGCQALSRIRTCPGCGRGQPSSRVEGRGAYVRRGQPPILECPQHKSWRPWQSQPSASWVSLFDGGVGDCRANECATRRDAAITTREREAVLQEHETTQEDESLLHQRNDHANAGTSVSLSNLGANLSVQFDGSLVVASPACCGHRPVVVSIALLLLLLLSSSFLSRLAIVAHLLVF
jgi:hypothetical protein